MTVTLGSADAMATLVSRWQLLLLGGAIHFPTDDPLAEAMATKLEGFEIRRTEAAEVTWLEGRRASDKSRPRSPSTDMLRAESHGPLQKPTRTPPSSRRNRRENSQAAEHRGPLSSPSPLATRQAGCRVAIVEALRQLMAPSAPGRPPIGFTPPAEESEIDST